MALKRKRDETAGHNVASRSVMKPAPGTQSFKTGAAVKDALSVGGLQGLTSFSQQIYVERSQLPLSITHPIVVILQHYLELSPECEEIFNAWRDADRAKAFPVAEKCVSLLSQIIRILTAVPFFRSAVVGIVNRLVGSTEPYADLISRLISSDRRDSSTAALALAGAAIAVDPPDPASSGYGNSGRLAGKVWSALSDGGCMKALPKLLTMRRRDKAGNAIYREADPLDKPDLRHLCLEVVLPMLSTQSFGTHSRQILRSVYNNLDADPPITILRLLTAIYNATSLPSPGIGRKISLTLLDENALDQIIRLLDRDTVEPSTGKSLGDIAMSFLEKVTTDPGRGVCFKDEGWYPRRPNPRAGGMDAEDDEEPMRGSRDDRIRRGLHNRILSNVVRKLGARVVSDKGRVGEWVVKVLRACPELVASYWPHCSLLIDARLESSWFSIMSYVGRIIALPFPDLSTFRHPPPRGTDASSMPFRPSPPSLENTIESIFPSPLTNVHLTKGLMHANHLVQYMTALTLSRAMQKLDAVQAAWRTIEAEINDAPSTSEESPWATMRREIEYECRRRAPEPMVIIAFAQKSATMAPAEPETAEEKASAARSAMLTEVALRLFGLYYRTMPSLTYEVKFDVGRLLVSSSSNKAEKRERQAAKAAQGSSVVGESEVGSLRSVGTAGTAGMGGGFGYARGDVEGFEALSQVHVVKLLRDVRDWQWTNKAAGSQYTYFYHILQLHLSTRQPTSSRLTTELLRSLLLPTLLFDADPSELDIYLNALPKLDGSPWGIIQGVYLLSFLDDAFKRCLQRPYKYIEDAEAVIPDYVSWDRQEDLPSPLLMTIEEQVVAKVVGSHISSEAAVVVLQYLRRILLGTLGKTPDGKFVRKLVDRLEAMLQTLEDKGLNKPAVWEAVRLIRADVAKAIGEEASEKAGEEIKDLTDESQWRHASFERICLDASTKDWLSDTPQDLTHILDKAHSDEIVRHGRFTLLLLASGQGTFAEPSVKKVLLGLVKSCIDLGRGSRASSRLKRALAESPWVKDAWTGASGDAYRAELGALVDAFDAAEANDIGMVEPVVTPIIDRFAADKKNKSLGANLALMSPWTPFLEASQAKMLLEKALAHSKRLSALREDDKVVLGKIVEQTMDVVFVSPYFATLVELEIIAPLSRLLLNSTSPATDLDCDEKVVGSLLAKSKFTTDAFELLTTLVQSAPSSIPPILLLLRTSGVSSMDHRMLPILQTICENQVDLDGINQSAIVTHALQALVASTPTAITSSALALVRRFSEHLSLQSLQAVISPSTPFSLSLAKLTATTAATPGQEEVASYLIGLALRYLVPILSSDEEISGETGACLEILTATLRDHVDVPVDLLLAEPVITAIIQERLLISSAVELAAVLAARVELKASFVRQHLQLLFSHSIFPTLTPTSSAPTSQLLRAPIIRLVAALFHASPYASCQPNLVEPILQLYGGTLSPADQTLLRVFQLFEAQRKVSIASLMRHWSANGKSASGGGKMLDALLSFDSALILKTCGNFPLRRAFTSVSATASSSVVHREGEDTDKRKEKMMEGLYDPLFVLLLFGGVLVEGGIRHLDWVEILRSNVLGMAVCALASRDAGMRRLASWVLSKAYSGISASSFQERDQLVYTLRLIRHALPAPSSVPEEGSKVARLPSLTTLFLAHALAALANPGSFLYPLASHFLLQRPTFDPYDVPMLFSMLYSSTDDHKRERGFIVRLIRDGTRSEADWRVLKRRRTWSLLAGIFGANPDTALRRLILQAMVNMSRIPAAARSLTYKNGLISWAYIQFSNTELKKTRNANEEQGRMIEIVENAVVAAVERIVIARPGSKRKATSDGDIEENLAGADLLDGQPTEGHMPEEELSSRDKGWIAQSITVVNLALRSAELDRLETLSRLAYRISSVPHTNASGDLLPNLTKRLATLGTTVKSGGEADEKTTQAHRIVELLFRISLCLQHRDLGMPNVQAAIRQIREWLEEAGEEVRGGEVVEWYKLEKRRAEWEDWQAAQMAAAAAPSNDDHADMEPESSEKKRKKDKHRAVKSAAVAAAVASDGTKGKKRKMDDIGEAEKGKKTKKEKKTKRKSA